MDGLTFRRLPRPEPSSGVAAMEAERAACLALDPRKAENYEQFLRHRRRRNVPYLPTRLDVENVSRCNFACTMCAVSKWPKGRRGRDMTLAEFKALIDEQYGLVEIKLNGIGEPLMGRDFFEMIRYARERRIWVRITTNGSLLHVRDNYKRLIDSGVNEIDISIDGANKAAFEAIRVQGDFAQVTENCATLNRYCAEKGIVRTKMWTLVQRGNAGNLRNHVALAATLGFKHLVFSVQLHGWGDPELAARNAEEQCALDHLEAHYLTTYGWARGVRVAFWDVADKFSKENLCPWPFERAVVTSDLRTVPCCMIGDPDKFEIGKGRTFIENWNGLEYAEFRQAHLDGRVPEVCKACYKEET